MSETPIVPVLHKRSEDIQIATRLRYQSGEVHHDFAAWEYGVDSESTLNLEREDSSHPELWQTEVEPAAAPVRVTELSRVEILKSSFDRMTDREVVGYIAAISAEGIVEGLRPRYAAELS